MNDVDLRLYGQLQQFPLFRGMSRNELLQLVGNTRFDFLKQGARKAAFCESDVCDKLFFLMKGDVVVESFSDDHAFRVAETLSSPWMSEADVLFGISPRHIQTVTCITECQFITLSKDEVVRLFDDILTFRLNLLNLLSTIAQQRHRRFWRSVPQSLSERIVRFFVDHSSYPAGRKEFFILMTQLANYVGASRLEASRALNQLQGQGLVELHRGRIVVPSLERLFQ